MLIGKIGQFRSEKEGNPDTGYMEGRGDVVPRETRPSQKDRCCAFRPHEVPSAVHSDRQEVAGQLPETEEEGMGSYLMSARVSDLQDNQFLGIDCIAAT